MSTALAKGGWGVSNKIALRAYKMRQAGGSVASIAKHFNVSYPTANKAINMGQARINIRKGQEADILPETHDLPTQEASQPEGGAQEYVVKLVKGAVFVSEATKIEGVSPEDALKVMRHLESVGLAQIYRLTK